MRDNREQLREQIIIHSESSGESDNENKIKELEERIAREIKLYLWQRQRLFGEDIKNETCTICQSLF